MRLWAALLLLLAGCKTRLLDEQFEGDLASHDLASADLATRDFSLPDLWTGDCPPEALLVYVVDTDKNLLSFRPDTLTFKEVRKLACPAPDSGYSPFSMAVQRNGTAWVNYASSDLSQGRVFKVDVKTGDCMGTPFVPQPGLPSLFGMGFSTDSATSTKETLYLASGWNAPFPFMTLDLTTFQLTQVGELDGSAELTSTPENLFGYFPNWNGMQPRIEQIDKLSGAPLATYPQTNMASNYDGDIAVAAWGGSFWIFVGNSNNPNSTTSVFQYTIGGDPAQLVIADTHRNIIGAGISTCKN